MTESLTLTNTLITTVSGYYVGETQKAIHIRLPSGSSLWVPKKYLGPDVSLDKDSIQQFSIDTWILEKLNCDLSKV